MTPVWIIGTTVLGAALGGVAGFVKSQSGGGDFNMASFFTVPVGALIGGFIGVVIGSIVFT